MKDYQRKAAILIILLLTLSVGSFVFADNAPIANTPNQMYFINLDQATIAKGYTVSAFANDLKLSLTPGILSQSTGIDIIQINEEMILPWQADKISKIYQFEFRNKEAYDNHKPFYFQFAYEKDTTGYKQVFFFDKNYGSWRPLPTTDFPKEKFVRSLIHLPFAKIAVFSNPGVLVSGQASWYIYKKGDFAASPDFPKGSRLRVYNTENNKFVDVEINDYGPDRNSHPGRVIDLEKTAFAKIASLRDGVINIRVYPLYVAADSAGRVLGMEETGIAAEPIVTAKAGVVMDEESGEILWSKNATATLPLASLTKLTAVKVFLEIQPNLDKEVIYKIQDEEFNYQYCDKWESARVNLKNGDILTTRDLVYSALVGSANNVVETLVRVSGLSRNDFIKKMNESALNWGATATNFVEPTGLSPDNVSSALDYVIITKKIFSDPIIQKASVAEEYKFSTVNTKVSHRLKNTNKLLAASNGFNITGSKTGYLNEAGYCLMIRAEAVGKKVIAVTFGVESRDVSFTETGDLIKYGINKLELSK